MNLEFYRCIYCFKEYRPTRRGVQKYCSDSCRVNSHRVRNKNNKPVNEIKKGKLGVNSPISKTETMSLSGIANAAVGSLLADGLKSAFTSNNSELVTKADISNLLEKLNSRYLLVNNMDQDNLGRYPYYDLITGDIIYLRINSISRQK